MHLRRETPPWRYQLASEPEFDVVVNRIVNTELRGIRVDSLRLVVESDRTSIDYPLDFNAADLQFDDHLANRGWMPLTCGHATLWLAASRFL